MWGETSKLVCTGEGVCQGTPPWPVSPAAVCSREGHPLPLASLVLGMDSPIGRIREPKHCQKFLEGKQTGNFAEIGF